MILSRGTGVLYVISTICFAISPSSVLAQSATDLDGTSANADVRFDNGDACWYIDSDADGTKDVGEQCIEDGAVRFARDYASGSATGGINEAIESCGYNATARGCHIWLPYGEIQINEPIQIGRLDGTGQQYGITLHGHGVGIANHAAGVDRCGTTIRTGSGFSSNDPMIKVDGAIGWRLSGFCLEGDTSSKQAGWGILIRGNNSPDPPGCCANNHQGQIDQILVEDITGTPGIGIAIAGADSDSKPGKPAGTPENDPDGTPHNDQVDFITISHSRVADSRECFRQDSQQAASNRLYQFECAKWTGTYGIVVLQGEMTLDNVYIGSSPAQSGQVGIRWEGQASQGDLNDLTFEWGSDDGTFIQFAGSGPNSQNVFTIQGGRFQSQSNASSRHVFISWEGRKGSLNIIGNRFFAANNASMGEFDFVAHGQDVPTYVNFVGNEYMCGTNSIDCSPDGTAAASVAINISNPSGKSFPDGGIRVTRQEEGIFRVYDESGSIAPATVYRFYGDNIDGSQIGKCLRTDTLGTPLSCGGASSVATTTVLAPSRPRVGALSCVGGVTGSGSVELAVRFRNGMSAIDSSLMSPPASLVRSSTTGAATLSWTEINHVSPYTDGLVSVVVDDATGNAVGELVCQLEVFH